ncbi:MAG TPA: dethiobiotin synthase [Candidatus Limnocylindria bacterium]|nr:dethiobiotin synthase [Candidatus Limnocylindria bacterium]
MTPRFYVTGTDTDVGKTVVTAAAARVLRERHGFATIVKIAQTGLTHEERGDAELAATLAGCDWREVVRFPKPADAWTAARDAGRPPLRVAEAAQAIAAIAGPLVVEGSGGAAVPLNETESITDVASRCGLEALLVVGLRLGCLNHALLTLEYLARRDVRVRGIVLCERWPVEPTYPGDVRRVLEPTGIPLARVPYSKDPGTAFDAAVTALTSLSSRNDASTSSA